MSEVWEVFLWLQFDTMFLRKLAINATVYNQNYDDHADELWYFDGKIKSGIKDLLHDYGSGSLLLTELWVL